MPVDPNATVAVVLAGAGAIIWAVRLEGRLNTHEKADSLVHARVEEKLDDLKEDLKDLKTHFGVKSNGKSS